jgi:hypothetical protein
METMAQLAVGNMHVRLISKCLDSGIHKFKVRVVSQSEQTGVLETIDIPIDADRYRPGSHNVQLSYPIDRDAEASWGAASVNGWWLTVRDGEQLLHLIIEPHGAASECYSTAELAVSKQLLMLKCNPTLVGVSSSMQPV